MNTFTKIAYSIYYENIMMKYLTRYGEKLSIGDEVLVQGINELTSTKVMNVSNISMRGKYILQNHDTFVMICRKKLLFLVNFACAMDLIY